MSKVIVEVGNSASTIIVQNKIEDKKFCLHNSLSSRSWTFNLVRKFYYLQTNTISESISINL